MRDLLDKLKEAGLDLLGADEADLEKVKAVIPVVKEGIKAATEVLEALERGDKEAFNAKLTEWEDVNRTLEAIHSMELAIEDSESGVTLKQVMTVVGTALKIAVTVGAFI